VTTEQKTTRKLAAIFSADVKAYSRLMTEDEAHTINTLKAYRDIISVAITLHSGRIVDAPGDNIMAEFASVVNAVKCAVEIQAELKIQNTDIPHSRRLRFRIGVNIGDVVQDDDSLYGEGVNIAARIEGLADPGGVCISRGAYDHIRNKLKLGYEYIGDHTVKNIKHPVRVYKLLMEPADVGKLIGDEPKPLLKPGTWATVIIVAIVLILIGYQVFQKFTVPEFEPASIEKMAFPLPDKPSIAVLAFDSMSGDKEQEYFSDGITDDIITTLSKTNQLFVISRNSTFTYKGKPVKIKKVAEELGVRYVLEGSVRKFGNRIRITAKLIDATSGNHLWAEKYDRDLKDFFALQDEITIKIITALRIKLTDGELAHLEGTYFKNLDVYLKVMEAGAKAKEGTLEGLVQYGRLAQEVIDMDPDCSLGYQHLGWYNYALVRQGKSPKESIKKAFTLAQKAISMDESNGVNHVLLGNLYLLQREYKKAIDSGERSVNLQPNSAMAHAMFAKILGYADRLDQSIEHFKKALRLDPFPDHLVYTDLCRSYTLKREYENALSAITNALYLAPESIMANCGQAALYALLNRQKEAEKVITKILEISPDFSLKSVSRAPFKNKAQLKFISDALRKAGLPETAPVPLPDKPSIAVLPFANMSDDKEQEYFSDGITENIITALSKTPKMFVIARNSTFTYKGKSVKVQEVGRDLGVRYVLEGSVRKAGNRVRVTAQLIDAKTGHHLWAEKYDRNLENIFALQDEITKNIITELSVELDEGEQARIGSKGTDNLDAYLKTLQARHYTYIASREGNTKAQQFAEQAIAADPDYAYAYRILGVTHLIDFYLGMSESPKKSIKLAMESFKKAVTLDGSLASAHAGVGYVLVMMRKYDEAVRIGKKAFDLEPNSPDVIKTYAAILTYDGRWEEAIPLFRLALRLNPKPSPDYYRSFCHALRLSGQHEEAIALLRKVTEQEPNDLLGHLMLAVAASMGGFDEEAKAVARELLRIDPQFSVKRLKAPFKDKVHLRNACEALNKAGLSLDCDALKGSSSENSQRKP
jgi:adenylate cyclase